MEFHRIPGHLPSTYLPIAATGTFSVTQTISLCILSVHLTVKTSLVVVRRDGMTFWKIVYYYYFPFFLFAIVGVSITGRQILAGTQKVFDPPLKNDRGDKTVTTSLVIYGAQSKLRARPYI